MGRLAARIGAGFIMTNAQRIGTGLGTFKALGCSLILLAAIPGFAQGKPLTSAAVKNWCFSNARIEIDLRIGGCTAVIQSGNTTTKRMADAYLNRGAHYLSKNSVDLAIADFSELIRLEPKRFAAFTNRGE